MDWGRSAEIEFHCWGNGWIGKRKGELQRLKRDGVRLSAYRIGFGLGLDSEQILSLEEELGEERGGFAFAGRR